MMDHKSMDPKVGAVILTYNRREVLKTCLSSVLQSKYRNYVVIVVDNASTDGTSWFCLNFPRSNSSEVK